MRKLGLIKSFGLIMLVMLVGVFMFGCAATPQEDAHLEGPLPIDDEHQGYDESNQNEQGIKDNVDVEGPSDTDPSTPDSSTTLPTKSESNTGSNTTPKAASKQDDGKSTTSCTLSINCSTVFDNLKKIDQAIVETLPKDGWIYPSKKVEFTEGESVFDILLRVVKQEKIHMESSSNPALKSKYVEGIHNLYEFDAGELSGWTFKVNGKGMGYGSSSIYPQNDDVIEWVYTCDQGRDVGVTAE